MSHFAIITDSNIAPLYGEALQKGLPNAHLFVFPAGEQHKTRQTKEWLEDQMQLQGLGRDTCLIALGGGVALDLGGFIASTYCRGIPLILIPTSLLAMVDSSIGGKNGVDTPFGKNMIGTFYPPIKTYVKPFFLETLPQSELHNGFVEMIKHGLIADFSYFEAIKHNSLSLIDLITRSRQIKESIVAEDPLESGKRRLLNFGHTIGHAIELISNYTISHGEAVAMGMLIESYMGEKKIYHEIASILRPYYTPLELDPDALIHVMRLDKKSLQGTPRFVFLESIGTPYIFEGEYCSNVCEQSLREAIKYALCSHSGSIS